MTITNFLAAIEDRLSGLWPVKSIYTDAIPQSDDGGFYVGVTEVEQYRRLDRSRRRVIQFEILYISRAVGNQTFADWIERMYTGFEDLEVGIGDEKTRVFHLTNTKAKKNNGEGYPQFLFDIEFSFVLSQDADTDIMENLFQEGGLR